jgi:hypothetical protein
VQFPTAGSLHAPGSRTSATWVTVGSVALHALLRSVPILCTLGVAAAVAAPRAGADTAVLSVSPTSARSGDFVEVRAGSYKRQSIRMPLYLVPRDKVPRFRRSVGAPRGEPYTFVGLLDFRERRTVRMRFRVSRVAPGLYAFVIYCDPCARGKRGSLITTARVSLRIRGGALASTAPAVPTENVTLTVGRIFDQPKVFRLRFSGFISSGAGNEYVAVVHQKCGNSSSTRTIAGATTREDGSWEVIPAEYDSPPQSGTFRARWKGHLSKPVTLRPPVRVLVAKLRARRYHVSVLADSLSGRFVALQRRTGGRWTHVRRIGVAASAQPDGSPFYTATVTVSTRGLKLRILVSKKTAAPCYLPAASKTFVS